MSKLVFSSPMLKCCPGWSTGMTQRDGNGEGDGRGFQDGEHINPWLIHINVWQNPLQYCKVISLQLKKINKIKCFQFFKMERK